MLESQRRKSGLQDGDRSPSSGKKLRNFTSLLPFGKKKNVDLSPGSPEFTKGKDIDSDMKLSALQHSRVQTLRHSETKSKDELSTPNAKINESRDSSYQWDSVQSLRKTGNGDV